MSFSGATPLAGAGGCESWRPTHRETIFGQGHLNHAFMPGLWPGSSGGCGGGGESTIIRVFVNDLKGGFSCGSSAGSSVTRSFGFKTAHTGIRSREYTDSGNGSPTVECSPPW